MKPVISRNLQCIKCRMYMDLCLCSQIKPLDLATRVVIFMHRKEQGKVSNTGMLAHRMLSNSQLVFRGSKDRYTTRREDFLRSEAADRAFLLFPSDDATLLDAKFLSEHPDPITLIVPDGHWGQAKRIVNHEPSLEGIPKVMLAPGAASSYQLRRNIISGRVCTYEAIMRALMILEAEQLKDFSDAVFHKMVSRLLWARNKIKGDAIYW